MKNNKGITLIALVITIIILIILAGVSINLIINNDEIIGKAEQAKVETEKQTATEKMNLKITNIQIEAYTKTQELPNLQKLADNLCEDNEIQYVTLASNKVASLEKITVGEAESIFTKMKDYPYEFEINSSLQLASVDGVQVAQTEENQQIGDLQKQIDEMKTQISTLQTEVNNQKDIIKVYAANNTTKFDDIELDAGHYICIIYSQTLDSVYVKPAVYMISIGENSVQYRADCQQIVAGDRQYTINVTPMSASNKKGKVSITMALNWYYCEMIKIK